MRPYSRVFRLEPKNARRLNHTNTAKKRSALRGGHEPHKKRIKTKDARPEKNEQVAGASTSRVTTPEGIPHSPSGSSTSRATTPRRNPHSSPSTSREQVGKDFLSLSQYLTFKKRFTNFLRCLMFVWVHACRQSDPFLNHVNTSLPPTCNLATHDFYEAARVMVNEGIDPSVPLAENIVRAELSRANIPDVPNPSVMIRRWAIFYFLYESDRFESTLAKSTLNLGVNGLFNGKQIMIMTKRDSARGCKISLGDFPPTLTVTSRPSHNSQKVAVKLQLQGIIFGKCLDPRSPKMTENFSIAYVRETPGPGGSYLLYDSKWSLPDQIYSDYQIPRDEELLVFYTI